MTTSATYLIGVSKGMVGRLCLNSSHRSRSDWNRPRHNFNQILQGIGRNTIEIYRDEIIVNGLDRIKYVAMHFWPIISYGIGRDAIIIGANIIQTNRITENCLRYDYDYIATNHN